MSEMDKFKIHYEELPFRIKNKHPRLIRRGGKDSKMSKSTKEAKTYKKSRTEHIKDVVIAMLITGIVAFGFGIHVANAQAETVSKAVQKVQSAQVTTDAPAVK